MAHARGAIAADSFGHSPARVRARRAARAHPRLFGRARPRVEVHRVEGRYSWELSEDLWLFGSTFAAGFLFVSILIA